MKRLLNVYIEKEQYEWLAKEAVRRDRAVAFLVREILKEHMDAKEKEISNPCPNCGREIIGAGAISTKDDMTQICTQCGIMEAIKEYFS